MTVPAEQFSRRGHSTKIDAEDLLSACDIDEDELAWRKEFLGLVEYEQTREIFEQSDRNIEQLKQTQRAYLLTLFGGTYDSTYSANRARVGKVHDLLAMPMKHYIGQYGVYYDLIFPVLAEQLTDSLVEKLEGQFESVDETSVESEQPESEPLEKLIHNHVAESFEEILSGLRILNLDMQVAVDSYLHSYNQQLQEQRDDIELLNEILRHDIRNHLQEIRGCLEILDERVEHDQTELIDRGLSGVDNAVGLTRTVREMAEVMKEYDSNEAIALKPVLESVIAGIENTSTAADITIENEIPAVSVRANGMLDSVFRNLLQNAVKHNDKSTPKIAVSVTEQDESVVVAIADNGPGVSPVQKTEIFGRGEKGLESPGTGIGLYLVDTLVERYGGAVWVEDNNPEGAIFKVQLPLSQE